LASTKNIQTTEGTEITEKINETKLCVSAKKVYHVYTKRYYRRN